MNTETFDSHICPYCGSTRVGVKKSEKIRSVQRQTKFCPKCKRVWYIDWRNFEMVAASDDSGNQLFKAPKKKG